MLVRDKRTQKQEREVAVYDGEAYLLAKRKGGDCEVFSGAPRGVLEKLAVFALLHVIDMRIEDNRNPEASAQEIAAKTLERVMQPLLKLVESKYADGNGGYLN